MPATIIMGGQWGDEGKGKLTDALAAGAAMVVRANGGSNAGHTVKTDKGVFKLHLIPSGILNDDVICVVGAGVVIDLETLAGEIAELNERGIDTSRLRISDRAHLVLPYHVLLDQLQERRREGDQIGTTQRGNGPAYADKVSRHGIRIGDLAEASRLRAKLAIEVDGHNAEFDRIYGAETLDFGDLYANLERYAEVVRPLIAPTEVLVQDALANGNHILIECAQGAMLDIDYGTYPFVTSSSPTAAGACQGAGVAPKQIDRVVGVYKAYSTRVGAGPMPTELTDATGDLIRERGHEYGTTTGRPRRTGWFDGLAARQSSRMNGVTDVALTLLDVLDAFPEIKLGTAYDMPDGSSLSHVPAVLDDLQGATARWQTVTGWESDTTSVRAYDDLPDQAQAYIAEIERITQAPVTYIGVGPGREQLIHRA